jgi:hypothetical protein
MKYRMGVSKLGRSRDPKEKGRAIEPGLLPFKTPVSRMILHSAASKKQQQKATSG